MLSGTMDFPSFFNHLLPLPCSPLQQGFCLLKITSHIMKLRWNMPILAMPISCNFRLRLQNICLESAQAQQQLMLMSAWVHNFHSFQDHGMFLSHPRTFSSPANHQQDQSMPQHQSHLNLLQFVSNTMSMMSATRISLRLNKVSNLITIAWGIGFQCLQHSCTQE